MTVETVLFDLDGTLCRPRRSRNVLLAEAFERAGVEPYCTAEELSAVAHEVEAAESDVEFYTNCLDAVAERLGAAVNTPAVARAYDRIADHSNVEFVPGAEATLDALHGEYTLGLVTNGGQYTQRQKLDVLAIADVFDTLVFATPEKGVKPQSSPFERALSALGTTPDATVHVGNSLRADVAGANAMGIESVWVPQTESPENGIEPDHALDSLADLPALL